MIKLNFVQQLRFIGLLCLGFLAVQEVSAQSQAAEINNYKKVFAGSSVVDQQSVCRQLEWAGISDTSLFDLIEKKLLSNYTDPSKERRNYNGWLTKALGYSGQEKYRATLQKVAAEAGHKSVKKHANNALKDLENYKQWNPIISSRVNYNANVSGKHNRYANMIRSGDYQLQTLAAKRISWESLYNDSFLLAELDKAVKASYMKDDSSKAFTGALANMTKVLAASGQEKYRPTIVAVSEKAANARLRKNAAKYLKKYYAAG